MKIKIVPKSGCAILGAMLLICLTLPFIDACNGMESTMYSEVKKAQDFDRWYECEKYLDKHPNGEHSLEVQNIFYEELEKDGRIDHIYKVGQRYSHLPSGRKYKDLAYKIALQRDTYTSWMEYLEVAETEDIKDAQERLDRLKGVIE